MAEGLEYASKMVDAMAAWAERCDGDKNCGFMLIAYEKGNENQVHSTIGFMGDTDIVGSIVVHGGMEENEEPFKSFVNSVNNRVAEKMLKDILKNGKL